MQTKSAIRAEYTTKLERQVKEITVEAGPISRSEAVFRSSLLNSALYQTHGRMGFHPVRGQFLAFIDFLATEGFFVCFAITLRIGDFTGRSEDRERICG